MSAAEPIYVETGMGIGKGLEVLATNGRCEVRPGEVRLIGAEEQVIASAAASDVSVLRTRFPDNDTYLVIGDDEFLLTKELNATARPGTAVAQMMASRSQSTVLEAAIEEARRQEADADDGVPAPVQAEPASVANPEDEQRPSSARPLEGGRTVDLGVPGIGPGRLVGTGGFGRVYLARHLGLDASVAVKLLDAHVDERAREAFRKEAQALGRLRGHPHIVTVYDEGFTADGHPYLLMEYAPGGSLADAIRRDGAQPWVDALDVVIKLCGAVETAHRAGVLHRDIKCANVLVSDYGQPRLADFGLSRFHDREGSRTSNLTMTLAYAAPELLADGRATVASDVYALGATLVTLVTGAPPFSDAADSGPLTLVRRIDTEPPPDLREAGAPDDLADAVRAAMAKDPSLRPASALNFGEVLQEVQHAHQLAITPLVLPDTTPVPAAPEDHPTPVTEADDLDGPTTFVAVDGTTGAPPLEDDDLDGATTLVDPTPTSSPRLHPADGDDDRGDAVPAETSWAHETPDGSDSPGWPPSDPPASTPRRRGPRMAAMAILVVLLAVLAAVVLTVRDDGGDDPVDPRNVTIGPASERTVLVSNSELDADALRARLESEGIEVMSVTSPTASSTAIVLSSGDDLFEAAGVLGALPEVDGAVTSASFEASIGFFPGVGDAVSHLAQQLATDDAVVALNVERQPHLTHHECGNGLAGATCRTLLIQRIEQELPRQELRRVMIQLEEGTSVSEWLASWTSAHSGGGGLYPPSIIATDTPDVVYTATGSCSAQADGGARGPLFTYRRILEDGLGEVVGHSYLVVHGDTLREIAACLSEVTGTELTYQDLIEANPTLDPNEAPQVGQQIDIPTEDA